jgi:hypothetical protein
MTKRRWTLLGLGTVAMVAVMGLAFWMGAPRHRINKESIGLIEQGMSQAEVEAIFGVPPGDYSSNTPNASAWIPTTLSNSLKMTFIVPEGEQKTWMGEKVGVTLVFNPLVVEKPYVIFFREFQEESVYSKFRRWLGL